MDYLTAHGKSGATTDRIPSYYATSIIEPPFYLSFEISRKRFLFAFELTLNAKKFLISGHGDSIKSSSFTEITQKLIK